MKFMWGPLILTGASRFPLFSPMNPKFIYANRGKMPLFLNIGTTLRSLQKLLLSTHNVNRPGMVWGGGVYARCIMSVF